MNFSFVKYCQNRKHLLSDKYFKYLNLHKIAHLEGIKVKKDNSIKKENAFLGNSLISHVKFIKKLIQRYSCLSLLDYGCGKALLYENLNHIIVNNKRFSNVQEYWGIKKNIYLYDPCYNKYDTFPQQKFDITICTDVLEHIPEEDLSTIIKELFILTDKVIFIAVPTYLSSEYLDNQNNSHATIKDHQWWTSCIKNIHKSFSNIDWYLVYRFNSEEGRKNNIISNTKL